MTNLHIEVNGPFLLFHRAFPGRHFEFEAEHVWDNLSANNKNSNEVH